MQDGKACRLCADGVERIESILGAREAGLGRGRKGKRLEYLIKVAAFATH